MRTARMLLLLSLPIIACVGEPLTGDNEPKDMRGQERSAESAAPLTDDGSAELFCARGCAEARDQACEDVEDACRGTPNRAYMVNGFELRCNETSWAACADDYVDGLNTCYRVCIGRVRQHG